MQFEKAIQALCDGGVEFVVIGGVSTTFHGSARVTYDLDICYSRAPENLSRITNALALSNPDREASRQSCRSYGTKRCWETPLCLHYRRMWVRSTCWVR